MRANPSVAPLQQELELGNARVLKVGASAHRGASTTDRDMAAWRVSRGSADAELLPELDTLVARSRDAERNNGVAESGFQTVHDNVLGAGLRLNPRPDYKALGKTKEWADDWSANVRPRWEGYYWSTACDAADELTGDQLTALQLRGYMTNGEAIGLPLWLPGRKDGWSTKMQLVEADRLSNPNWAPDSDTLRAGVKLGKYGERLGYYFRSGHPGDRFMGAGVFATADTWTFVPRKTPWGRLRVLHLYDPKRVGQTRGKPLLSSILHLFKNLDRYQGAELQAALANALIAMTIETPSTHEQVMEWFKGDAEKYMEWRNKAVVELRAGNILTLMPGDKANAFLPARPATAFEAFVVTLFRQVALAFDLPYEMLMKDWSRLNYVTLRAALSEAWRAFNRRRDFITSHWLDPWYALWLEEEVNAGNIEAPDFYANRWAYEKCRWIGPGRGALDPAREAQAAQILLDNNVSTLEDICGDAGKDWAEVVEQRATEIKRLRELGLPEHSALRAANPASQKLIDPPDDGTKPSPREPDEDEIAGADERAAAVVG